VRPAFLSFFRDVLCSGAGVAGGNSLFFCFAKSKVSKRKGDPTCCVPTLRYGQPAVLGPAGVSLELATLHFAQTIAIPDPSGPALLGASRRGGRRNTNTPIPNIKQPKTELRIPEETRTRRGESLLVFVFGIWSPLPFPIAPCGCAEARRFKRIRDRDCLSRRRVRARPRLNRAPQVARSEAKGRRNQGRLFFGDFLLAKQKKVTCCRQPRPAALSSERTAEAGKASTSSARTVGSGLRYLSPNGFRGAAT
jgi:hypothetical protein